MPTPVAKFVATPLGVGVEGQPTLYDSGVVLRYDREKLEVQTGGEFVVTVRARPEAVSGEVLTLEVVNERFPEFPPRVYELKVV